MTPKNAPAGHRKVSLAVVVSIFVLGGCQGTTTVPITSVYGEPSSTSLELSVGSCHAPLKADLDEKAGAVMVTVEREDGGEDSSGDCQDSLSVELSNPLADRTVVDASSGQPVEVQAPN